MSDADPFPQRNYGCLMPIQVLAQPIQSIMLVPPIHCTFNSPAIMVSLVRNSKSSPRDELLEALCHLNVPQPAHWHTPSAGAAPFLRCALKQLTSFCRASLSLRTRHAAPCPSPQDTQSSFGPVLLWVPNEFRWSGATTATAST